SSMKLVKAGGHFIELGKRGIFTIEEAATANPDMHYHVVAIDDMIQDLPDEYGILLNESVGWMLREFAGDFQNYMKITTFPVVQSDEEAQDAFRYLQRARHIGKVVIEFPSAVGPAPEEACLLITGGFGSLGGVVANWAVDEGVKHIALVSRNTQATLQVSWLQNLPSVQVVCQPCDITNRTSVEEAVTNIEDETGRAISMVFHAAGVLEDGL